MTHHLSSTLQEFVGSVGIGDPKTCWLVDSGASCHIVSEKWVKHYTVSFEYQGPRPSLKGAGDNDLPVKGVVDLEFMVGKTKVTMKRVVIVGIPLNVISTYALLETGWKTVLGNAEQSGLVHGKTKFPLKISDRAWWLKVTLPKRKGGKSSGTVPMDLSTVSTGNVVNSGSTKTKQTKQTTDCKRNVAAVVPVDDVAKESVSKDLVSKDTSTKDPVNHVATQEVAQVKGRSGGSAKVKVKRREPEFRSADMLQSFSYVCRMFHFGSSHLFQHDFHESEPNTNENETEGFVETNVETSDADSDDFLSCDEGFDDVCEEVFEDFDTVAKEGLLEDSQFLNSLSKDSSLKRLGTTFCHGTSGHMDWEYHVGRTSSGQADRKCSCDGTLWTLVSG